MPAVHVAVVGAGIIGCLIARELTLRDPNRSVVVLDRDMIGCGAARRSAGLHIPRGATRRVRAMTEYSQDFYAMLRLARPALPIRPLPMTVVSAEEDDRTLRERYLVGAALTATRTLSCTVARLPEGARAWTVRGGQYADVHGLTRALAHEVRPRVDFREGTRITGVDATSRGIVLRLGTGQTLTADRVILAPGPWIADPAWAAWLAPLGLRVKKIVALHIRRPPVPTDGVVVYQDEDAFLLPLHGTGHWLYSYTCRTWDVDPDTVGRGLTPADVAEATESLRRTVPALVGDGAPSARVFCDAYGPAGEPIVEAIEPTGRIVFAGAGSGLGYRLGPAVARDAAEAVS